MEASKFIKESARMCHQYNYCCAGCPVDGGPCIVDGTNLANDDKVLEKYIATVEKWSAEHPVKTNIIKLEEVFGHEVIAIIRGYAAGMTDEEVFRDAFMRWLGEEYKDVDKK